MGDSRGITEFLRGQYQQAHGWLEGTMERVTDEVAQKQPGGVATAIGAQYGHIAVSEDYMINGLLRGEAPVMATTRAGQTGLSALPPGGENWGDWAREVQAEVTTLRSYAQDVYAATDSYLASLADSELARPIDLSFIGLGMQNVGFVLTMMLANVNNHCGEIACLKGLQGLKGYPA
ncbi:MAG TPA: DinB family protein [Chloroflexota bacterium]|nr:DinB family protein [Chloroflexota bacterium]